MISHAFVKKLFLKLKESKKVFLMFFKTKGYLVSYFYKNKNKKQKDLLEINCFFKKNLF